MQKTTEFQISNYKIPQISAADFASVKPPYIHFRRQYHEYILYFILSGEMFLAEGEKEYHLKENDLILLEPSMEHRGTQPSICRFFYVHFTWENFKSILHRPVPEEVKEHPEIIFPKHHSMETGQGILQVRETAEQIVHTFHSMETFHCQQAACQLMELLLEISSDYEKGLHSQDISMSRKAKQIIPELMTYLNQHYAEDISGNLIQEHFHYHFDYLNRQFRKWTGQTIFAYLNAIRITRAKQLLETGFYTVGEAARQTGFCDIYYFSKVFKKHTGISPGQIKRKG